MKYSSASERSRVVSVRRDAHNHHVGVSLNCVYEFDNSPIHMQLPTREMVESITNSVGISNLISIELGSFRGVIQKFVNSLHRVYGKNKPTHNCSRSIGPTGNTDPKGMLCSKCVVYYFMANIKSKKDGTIEVSNPEPICVALLEYGKLFSAQVITTIDNLSIDDLRKNIIYAPSSLASKFIAI